MKTSILYTKLGYISVDIHNNCVYGLRFVTLLAGKHLDNSFDGCPTLEKVLSVVNDESHEHIPVIFAGGTKFQNSVWKVLGTIPRGQIATYMDIAHSIGKPNAVRAVANACGANPVPILVPCHRVVRSDGGIGGYSSGVDIKKKLLAREGINF